MDELLNNIYEELIHIYENHIKEFLITLLEIKGWKELKKKEIFNYDPESVHIVGNIDLISEDYEILIHTMLFDYYEEKKEYDFGLWIQINRADNGYYHHLGEDGGQCTLKSLDELSRNTRKIMEDLWNNASKEIAKKYSNKLMWQLGKETLKHFITPTDYIHTNLRFFKQLLKKNVWEDEEYTLFEDPIILIVEHEENNLHIKDCSLGLILPSHNWIFMPKCFRNTREDLKEFDEFMSFIETRDFKVIVEKVECNFDEFQEILLESKNVIKYDKKSISQAAYEMKIDKILKMLEKRGEKDVVEKLANIARIKKIKELMIKIIFEFLVTQPDLHKEESRYLPENLRNVVIERDDGICQLCNKKPDKIFIDHIFPYSLGGGTTEMNLMVSCEECNRDKGKKIDFFNSPLGGHKLLENIKSFISQLPMITNFVEWLKSEAKIKEPKRKSNK